MFCPECGTLSFPTPSGHINCTNYKCGYQGPADNQIVVDGKKVNTAEISNQTKAVLEEKEVIEDLIAGVLTVGDYMCPKCDSVEVYSYLEQTRSSDEPETRMLTCANKECKNGWREY